MNKRPGPIVAPGLSQFATMKYQIGPMTKKLIPERSKNTFVSLKKCPKIIQIKHAIVEPVSKKPSIRLMFSIVLAIKVFLSILHISELFGMPAN